MGKLKKLLRMLIRYPLRLFNGISLRAKVIDSKVNRKARIEHHANVRYSKVGAYTYLSSRSSAVYSEIGKFCSIASGVAIGGGAHEIDSVSTSPVFNKGRNVLHKNFASIEFDPYKITTIGNDVWIGNRALVLQGVTIADGAIVGAGAVVTKDVEPYSIVAGNPAKLIRKRFSDEEIARLLELKCWDKDEAWLNKYGKNFKSPGELFNSIER